MWVRYWKKRQTKQIILLSGRNRELWSRLRGDSDEQIGKTLCLDYVGMGLGLSDLFRSSSVPFFSALVVLLLLHLLFLGKDLRSVGIHTL